MARPTACTTSTAMSTAMITDSSSPQASRRDRSTTPTASAAATSSHGTADCPGTHVMVPVTATAVSPWRSGIDHSGRTTWVTSGAARTAAGVAPAALVRWSDHVTEWPPDTFRHSGGTDASALPGTATAPPVAEARFLYRDGA